MLCDISFYFIIYILKAEYLLAFSFSGPLKSKSELFFKY